MEVYSSSNLTPTRSDASPHLMFSHIYHYSRLYVYETGSLFWLVMDTLLAERLCSVFPVRILQMLLSKQSGLLKNKSKLNISMLRCVVLTGPIKGEVTGNATWILRASHPLQRALALNCNSFHSIFDLVTKSAVHQRASPLLSFIPPWPNLAWFHKFQL